jgi:hypothetical protein
MSEITIHLDHSPKSFRPGDAITGSIEWVLDEIPRSVEAKLVWSTAGKGTRDIAVVQNTALHAGRTRDQQRFELHAPEGPYSFSGKLVSLVWAVEAVMQPGDRAAREEIVISPSGAEIDLYAAGEPEDSA